MAEKVLRSRINAAMKEAEELIARDLITLHGNVGRDWTNFGGFGELCLFNVTSVRTGDGQGYWEKLMVVPCRSPDQEPAHGAVTPMHTHKKKTETISVVAGTLLIQLFGANSDFTINRGNGVSVVFDNDHLHPRIISPGTIITMNPGVSITLRPGDYHLFWGKAVLREVSTWNDDEGDNLFADPEVTRFPLEIDEDEPPIVWLVSDKPAYRQAVCEHWGQDSCPPVSQGIVM